MCGIFGIIGSEKANREIFLGLLQLQHRGQDAAGILMYDFEHPPEKSGIVLRKGFGLVNNVFNELTIASMRGSMGIGHTRYPTAGTGDESEIQPFFLQYPEGIGLALNGNIVNFPQLKKELSEKNRRHLASNCDAEVLLHIFAEEYSKNGGIEGIFRAVKTIYDKVIGGYSVVMLIAGKGLLAFRDPSGIRPMLIGKRGSDSSYAIASEDKALDLLEYKDIRNVLPGEAIFIDEKLNLTSRILAEGKRAACSFEWIYFANVESSLEGKSVYEVRSKLGIKLAEKIKTQFPDLKADVVIPVPDTSRTAANSLARALGIPYEEGLIKNRYIYRTFIMATQKKREDAIKLKLKPIEYVLKGKNVIIVDDSIVRGTTSKCIIKLVRDAGANKVYYVSTFPPIRYPCFYGIDFQSSEELMAHGKTVDEVEKAIGVDKLIYSEPKFLEEAIGVPICYACVSGKYPTKIDDAEELARLRKEHIKITEANHSG